MNCRLCHDVAFAASLHILEVFALREEEKQQAFGEIYHRVTAALEAYDLEREKMDKRLNPTNN